MTLRLSTRDYTRREGDDVVTYRGDLGIRAIRYSRELSFWPWGQGADGSLATGTLEIDNRDGRYDPLITLDMRDQPVSVRLPTKPLFAQFVVTDGEFDADGQDYFVRYTNGGVKFDVPDIPALTAIVDSTEAPDDRTVRVALKDTLTLLDVPIQQDTFSDEADESIEGRPLPITLGVARTIRPVLWEAFPASTGPAYRMHDSTLSGVTNVRDKGIALNPLSTPAQWSLDGRIGNAGITLDVEPVGVVTVDASSSGDAVIPVTPTDVLNGTGQFDTTFPTWPDDPSGGPAGWVVGVPTFQATTNRSVFFDGDGCRLELTGSMDGGQAVFVVSDSAVLEAGKTYRWRFRQITPVTGAIGFGPRLDLDAPTSQTAGIPTTASPTQSLFFRQIGDPRNEPQTYTGIYTVPNGTDRYVRFTVRGRNAGCTVGECEFVELPPPPVDELEGITLKDYALEVIRRVGLPDDRLVAESIDAVDPDEAEIGLYLDSPITALGVLRAPLDSYCADVYSDRDGRYRLAQLRDPDEESVDLVVDANNLARPPRVTLDKAEGLTTSIIARRNYYQFRESDFADNPTALPLDLRAKLTGRGQFQRNAETAEPLPTVYRHAIEAEPLVSLFDDPADALAQIQRVVDLYTVVRYRVDVEIWLDPGEFVELDQVVELVYPRYGFDEGRKFLVYGVTDEVTDKRRICRLRLWG